LSTAQVSVPSSHPPCNWNLSLTYKAEANYPSKFLQIAHLGHPPRNEDRVGGLGINPGSDHGDEDDDNDAEYDTAYEPPTVEEEDDNLLRVLAGDLDDQPSGSGATTTPKKKPPTPRPTRAAAAKANTSFGSFSAATVTDNMRVLHSYQANRRVRGQTRDMISVFVELVGATQIDSINPSFRGNNAVRIGWSPHPTIYTAENVAPDTLRDDHAFMTCLQESLDEEYGSRVSEHGGTINEFQDYPIKKLPKNQFLSVTEGFVDPQTFEKLADPIKCKTLKFGPLDRAFPVHFAVFHVLIEKKISSTPVRRQIWRSVEESETSLASLPPELFSALNNMALERSSPRVRTIDNDRHTNDDESTTSTSHRIGLGSRDRNVRSRNDTTPPRSGFEVARISPAPNSSYRTWTSQLEGYIPGMGGGNTNRSQPTPGVSSVASRRYSTYAETVDSPPDKDMSSQSRKTK
jgi:hypothetical protein